MKRITIITVLTLLILSVSISSIFASDTKKSCSHINEEYRPVDVEEELHEVWCSDCGIFLRAEAHTISAHPLWHKTVYVHWTTCEKCGETIRYANHFYINNICRICGMERAVECPE